MSGLISGLADRLADLNTGSKWIGHKGVPLLTFLNNVIAVNIMAYAGVDATGAADSTAAMNSAHATGQPVFYPPGTYKFSTLNPISSGGIIGYGRTATTLKSTDTGTANLITFTGASTPPMCRDFTLLAPATGNLPTKTGGAGIMLQPASGEIDYAHFENVTVAYCPTCFDLEAAAYFTWTDCEALGWNVAGITVNNSNNPDSGDSVIHGGVISTPGTAGAGIVYKASGGLKVIGTKLLGGANNFSLQLTAPANTSDLLLVGVSMENAAQQNMVLARNSGTATFGNIVLAGGQMLVATYGLQSDASGAFYNLCVSGTVFSLQNGATAAIDLTGVQNLNIGEIVIKGNGGAPNGINTAASCTGKIGRITQTGLTKVVNNSSANVTVHGDTQRGQAVTSNTGWGGYGSVFAGPATSVAFPQAYTDAPSANDITLTPAATNGEIGGIVTAISATGFTFIPISSVTGISAHLSWACHGGRI